MGEDIKAALKIVAKTFGGHGKKHKKQQKAYIKAAKKAKDPEVKKQYLMKAKDHGWHSGTLLAGAKGIVKKLGKGGK